jgi:ribosomal protein S18 acetylase RimI-like enzyme
MTAIITRDATIGDINDLYRIIQAAYRTNNGWTNEAKLVSGERVTKDELRAIIQKGHDPLIVAVDDGKVVGCISAEASHLHPSLQLPDYSALIGLFSVDPELQSRGIGRLLFNACIDHVKTTWKCKYAVLWVIETRSDLLKWYEKMGFKFTGDLRDFVMPDKLRVAGLKFKIYIKSLSE